MSNLPNQNSAGVSAEKHLENEKHNAADEVEKLKHQTRDAANETVDQAKKKAKEVGSDLASSVESAVRNQKSNIAAKINEFKSAGEAAVSKLEGEEHSASAQKINQVVSKLGKASDYLENTEPQEMFDDFSNYARKRPEVVLGGLFIVGLGVSRFLKASGRSRSRAQNTTSRNLQNSPNQITKQPYSVASSTDESHLTVIKTESELS